MEYFVKIVPVSFVKINRFFLEIIPKFFHFHPLQHSIVDPLPFVLLPIYMDKCNFPIPFSEHILDINGLFFSALDFDLVISRKLLNDKLRIRAQLNFTCTEFNSALNTIICTKIFRLVIGFNSKCFIALFYRIALCIGNVYTESGVSGVIMRAAIGINEKFGHEKTENENPRELYGNRGFVQDGVLGKIRIFREE